MINLLQIIIVPIISALVYGALAGYKILVNGKEKWIRIIPVIAALLGVVLGVIAFYAVPEVIAADNLLTAMLIGGASGLAATGTNQIFKQLFKKPGEILKLFKKPGKTENKDDNIDDKEGGA